MVCPHPFCRLKGHKTTKSNKCTANPACLAKEGLEEACAAAVAVAASANPKEEQLLAALHRVPRALHDEKDADDLDNWEAMGLNEDPQVNSDDEFFECDTFSDQEEDGKYDDNIIDVGVKRVLRSRRGWQV
jgi:hypothetical protein